VIEEEWKEKTREKKGEDLKIAKLA